ncbi:MAG: PH domain-containing protein [Candidatus Heimdallarchaeota archaeon]|nr:MAG: PH domain-containing protein [Candidatus Heimdallarchaeota archaeon]
MKSSIQGTSEEPLVIIKPKFLTFVAVLKSLPVAVFLGLFGGIGVLMVTLIATGQSTDGGTAESTTTMMFTVGAIGFFMLGAILSIWYRKTSISHIEYRIFANRIEYFEGLFTVEQKTFNFVDVSEIYLRKGVLQKRYNLGSIFLMTRGLMLPMVGMRGNIGGMILRDIEDPDAIYHQLKQLKDTE